MRNFVLVHGTWHGGWCWSRVASLLRTRGHIVWTPTQTGSGERAHLLSNDITLETFVQDITGVLQAEELDEVVLVGHSSGGVPVTGVADRMPERLRSVIFLDALILQDGETLLDHFSPVQTAMYEALHAAGETIGPAPPAGMLGVPEGPDADWVNRRMTPISLSIAENPFRLNHPVGNGLRCSYIACVSSPHPFVASGHAWAKSRTGWQWRELETGHDAMITMPGEVADLLEELA